MMYDCPECEAPLRGNERTCPSCGNNLRSRSSSYGSNDLPQAPPFNPMPFVIVAIVLIGAGGFAASQSWIGQALLHPQAAGDPIDSMKPAEARMRLESTIQQGLTAVNAPAKFIYKADEKATTRDQSGPVELTVETKLQDPTQRVAIMEPAKQFMSPALIPTLKVEDAKSHATWTYTVALQAAPKDDYSFNGIQQAAEQEQQSAKQKAAQEAMQQQQQAQQPAPVQQQQYQRPQQQQQYQQPQQQQQYQQPVQQQQPQQAPPVVQSRPAAPVQPVQQTQAPKKPMDDISRERQDVEDILNGKKTDSN